MGVPRPGTGCGTAASRDGRWPFPLPDAAGRVAFQLTGPPGSQPEGFLPGFKHRHRKTRDVTVAFGHWAALGLQMKKRYLALDSGCVWGGQLSAIRLEDRALFLVSGKKR